MAAHAVSQTIRRSLAMGPSVRNLLSQYKLDPSQITSTGPHKTLLKSDVLAYINQQQHEKQQQSQQPKAPAQSNIFRPKVNQEPLLSKRYSRKYPTQLEIDVINNGGLID